MLVVACVSRVVPYSISTSNHNARLRTSASNRLFLIRFLHQTTTCLVRYLLCTCCSLFDFYIKPQPRVVFSVIPNKLHLFQVQQKWFQDHEEVRLMRYFLSYQCKYSKNKVASKQKSQKSPSKKLQLLGGG